MGLGNFRQPRSPGRPTLRRRAAGALLALAAFVIPAAAQAQNTSDSQVVETQASIIGPGTMIKIADIDFGKIVRPLSAGTVVLAPTANPPCTLTGGVEVRSGPCTSAYFAIMGRNMGVVRISKLDAVSVVLNGSNGGTMTMTNLLMSYQNLVLCSGSGVGNCGSGGGGGSNPQNRMRITSQNGIAHFRIGGTLNVGANQPVGTYTGTFQVEVNFN